MSSKIVTKKMSSTADISMEREQRMTKLQELAANPPRRGRRTFTDEDREEILSYVAAGHSNTNIAKSWAKNPQDDKEVKNLSLTIGRIVREAGGKETIRGRGAAKATA